MQKYKNISWSLGSYAVSFVLFLLGLYAVKPQPSSITLINPWLSIVALIFVLYGIFCGFRSIKSKESTWAGYVITLIGFAMLIFSAPIIFNFLLAFSPV